MKNTKEKRAILPAGILWLYSLFAGYQPLGSKDKQYSPRNDFNSLCELIEAEGLTLKKFVRFIPEDRESQRTLINYIDNSRHANPTILEFLIENRHASISSKEFNKITDYLLELGSPITTLVLQNPECQKWISKCQAPNWSCAGDGKGYGILLSNLIDMRFSIDTLEKVIKLYETEIKSKARYLHHPHMTYKALEYSNEYKQYATELVNFLMKYQLIVLSLHAFKKDSVTGIKLIKTLGSACLKTSYRYHTYEHNIALLNHLLRTFQEPFDLIKALLNAEPKDLLLKIFQQIHENRRKNHSDVDLLNPLETVIFRYLDNSLEFSKTKELIIFLVQKGAFPSAPVLLTLKEITDPEIQNELLHSIMLNYEPAYIDTDIVIFEDWSVYSRYTLELLEALIQFNPPILWISRILDFVDTRYWKESFYDKSNNNLLELALKGNQDKTYTLKLIEFLLNRNAPINLIKLKEILNEINDKEFYDQLLEPLIPKLIQLLNFDSSNDEIIARLLYRQRNRLVGFIDSLEQAYSDYGSTLSRLTHSLQSLYIDYTNTENRFQKKKLSELLGMMPEPVQQKNPLPLEDGMIDVNPWLDWRDQVSYYFTTIKSHLREHTSEATLSIIFDYLKPFDLTKRIIENHELKSIHKLRVPSQSTESSECGIYAFTYSLLILSFFSENIKLPISILKNTFYQPEENKSARRIFEVASEVAATASENKQNGSDVSPITMRKMIHHRKFKEFFNEIYKIHQLYPAIVPVIKKDKTYEIPADFDIIEQLNMLYKFIAISNLCHHKKVIHFIWYVFTEHHWTAVVMTTLENGQNIFLVCDSLSNHNIEFVTPIVFPIQQMVTNTEKLQDLCAELLARSYQGIDRFIQSEASQLTTLSLRHLKEQLYVWLFLMNHYELNRMLGNLDAVKFEIMVKLITAYEKLTREPAVEKHKALISELRRFDLFHEKKHIEFALTPKLKKFDSLGKKELDNKEFDDNTDLVTLVKIANILESNEFKADKRKFDEIYDHVIKNKFFYVKIIENLVDKIKKSVDVNDESLLEIASKLRLTIFLEGVRKPKDKELQKKLLFSVQSLFNRLESAFFMRSNCIQLIKIAKFFEISIPFDPIKFLEDKKNDIHTHIEAHASDYSTTKEQIITKINLMDFKISVGCDDVLFKVGVELGTIRGHELEIFQMIPDSKKQINDFKEDFLYKLDYLVPCEIRWILDLKKIIKLALLSEVITHEDAVAWTYSLGKDRVTAESCQSLFKEISDKIRHKDKPAPQTVTLLMQALTEMLKLKKAQKIPAASSIGFSRS